MRRLNRAEYQHTMTDLLGFGSTTADELPNDSLSADGFLNNGASQVTSAVQIENYLKSARKALDYVLLWMEGSLKPRPAKWFGTKGTSGVRETSATWPTHHRDSGGSIIGTVPSRSHPGKAD